jgi:hypothetical protein
MVSSLYLSLRAVAVSPTHDHHYFVVRDDHANIGLWTYVPDIADAVREKSRLRQTFLVIENLFISGVLRRRREILLHRPAYHRRHAYHRR